MTRGSPVLNIKPTISLKEANHKKVCFVYKGTKTSQTSSSLLCLLCNSENLTKGGSPTPTKLWCVRSLLRGIEPIDKIILVIKHEKTWKIAFSLCGVTWPRGEEPYADDAFELLRQTVLHRSVEVLMDTLDEDGYFIGTLLASNTHVAIPLLEVGLAKMEEIYLKDYNTESNKAQKSARSKKLKIWENYV